MSQIFISYAKEDQKKVKSLVKALETRGWHVWWDQYTSLGKTYDEVIQSALDDSDLVIVVWTRHSVSSRWVRSEAERAANQDKLFPVMMEEVQLPLAFSLFHAVNLSDWKINRSHQGFDQLVKEISAVVAPDSIATDERNKDGFKKASIIQKLWPLITLCGVPIILILILSSTRIQKAGIIIQARVTDFNFVSSKEQEFSDILVLNELKIAGLKKIRIPRSKKSPERTIDANNNAEKVIILSKVGNDSTAGTISLAPLSLSKGISVRLYSGKNRLTYHVHLQRSEFPIRVTVQGPIAVKLSGAPREIVDFGPPKPLLLQTYGNGVDLELSLAPDENLLTSPLSISGLSFYRLDEHVEGDRTIVQHISTILSGFYSFDYKESIRRQLIMNEGIRLKNPVGKIQAIRLHDENLEIEFKGYVQELSSCSGDKCATLIPTYFKWIAAQYWQLLIAGAILYSAFAIWIGFLWRRLRKGMQGND